MTPYRPLPLTSEPEFPPIRRLVEAMKGMTIVLIVGVHLHRGWFGWEGVHVFITLSGFTLALAYCAGESATWTRWYRRRAVRILPAYWLTAVGGADSARHSKTVHA